MKEFLEKLDEAKVKSGIRIAAVVVMVCFFFPFFMVSCDMQTIEITGADIAKGMGEYVSPHPVAYGVLILAGIVLAVTFIAKVKPWRKLISLICAVAGLVLMAIIHSGFIDAMKELGASSEEIAKYASTKFGFWGCVLGYLAIAVFSCLYGRCTDQESIPVVDSAASQPVDAPPAIRDLGTPPAESVPVADSAASQPVDTPPVLRNLRTPPGGKRRTCPCCGHTQSADRPKCAKCGYEFIVV